MKSILFTVMTGLFLASQAFSAQVSLNYGEGPGKIAFFNSNNHPDSEEPIPLGPLSFRVSNGEFWVANSVNGRILRVSAQGKILSEIEAASSKEGVLLEDLALEQQEKTNTVSSVWVLDGQSQQVIQLSPDGKKISSFGQQGNQSGQFLQIHRIEIGPSGNLYIADKGRQAILIFAKNGKFLREIAWEWSGFLIDSKENLYYLKWNPDEKKSHLIIETPDGKLLKDVPLDLGDHTNPELWALTNNNELLISFLPPEGFNGKLKLATIKSDGKLSSISDFKPLFAMNRLLVQGHDGALWQGAGDYDKAPEGHFEIEKFSTK